MIIEYQVKSLRGRAVSVVLTNMSGKEALPGDYIESPGEKSRALFWCRTPPRFGSVAVHRRGETFDTVGGLCGAVGDAVRVLHAGEAAVLSPG